MKPYQKIFILVAFLLTCLLKFSWGQVQDPCAGKGKIYYYAIEIDGILCGYSVSYDCLSTNEGIELRHESNDVFMKLSVLGKGVDIRIQSVFSSDPVTKKLMNMDLKIVTGNSTMISSTRIKSDTAWYTANSGQREKAVPLGRDVILETALMSPHLYHDFVQEKVYEKKYKIYEPIRGEIIEKSYSCQGDEDITLLDSTFNTLVLKETDLSTGTISSLWLDKRNGMQIKVLIAGRNIYLTDKSVVSRISTVDFDNLIFARVNKVIPGFQDMTYLKVKARIESAGEILSANGLNFPGQKFTGTVTDNLIDGVFEIEAKRYDGSNAPLFPPDFSKDLKMKNYLEPELLIESDDPLLVGKAREIAEGSRNSWEAAVRMSKWVAHNIEGAIPGGGSAANTYKMRQGECGGHSRLLTAFCRAVSIPARLSIGCMYSPHYGGSFGQHAWTEVYMGEAGWIAVDATVFEIDYVDAGHIRLGEKSTFMPKEMEILDFRLGDEQAGQIRDSIPIRYLPYLGKYTDMENNRVFKILYQDNSLTMDIPGQMVLALEDPDENGRWYPKLTRQISLSFHQNKKGKVDKMGIRQMVPLVKISAPDSVLQDVPANLIPNLGKYSLAQAGLSLEVSFSDGSLRVPEPLGKSEELIKLIRDGEAWKDEQGNYEFIFETSDQNEVTRLIIYPTFLFPKGEPAAVVIESVILKSGIEAGLEKYDSLKTDNHGDYIFSEGMMNALGYRLLTQDKTAEAIEIFKLNAAEHPGSFNVYDSLGEAYMKLGNKKLAIRNYKKSLELNPDNENGKKMLEQIKSGS